MNDRINPATGELWNRVRADAALEPANAFALAMFGGRSFDAMLDDGAEEDASDVIADLITNLLHLARACALEPEAIARQALANFEQEEEMEADAPEAEPAFELTPAALALCQAATL